MHFKDIIGQDHLKTELPELLQDNRLAHALIFLGKEGSGALPLALAFAQFVVCEKVNGRSAEAAGPSLFGDEPATTPARLTDSCGVCPSCQKAAKLVHPDIHFSYPVVTKKTGSPPVSTDYITEWREFIQKQPYGNVYDWLQYIGADNKQGNITANECNEIIRKLNLKSFESEYKILIMWMPEYLGHEGNKLLKLIEEPPANTLFILVAENESLILQTILSRCQLVKVPLLEDADVTQALVAQGTEENAARQIAAVSEGNFREALQQVQHADEDWHNLLREWLNAILKNGPVAQVKWVEKASGLGREKQKQFLRYFNHLLAQSVRLRVLGENAPIPDQDRDFALRLNKIADLGQQQAIIEELDKAAYYVERNANAKMLFHALTIKVYHIIQDKIVFLAD
ncbi:MAG: hypothetical protein NVV59_03800 [Chitinophagaceae bacterium]|nr:hypothetical protein [Chitinophagaceae bacterium]